MDVHLVDGTYELFRHYFAVPSSRDAAGLEVGALRGVAGSVLNLLAEGATHVGVATDHVVESFRNEMWPGYKTGEGVPPELLSQFVPLEETLQAMGVLVWPMVELEADDALASGAWVAEQDASVDRVFLCTPDKDLSQCVRGDRVVQLDRRRNEVRDAEGVRRKFGVDPPSIPDYLGLVGDSADGFPGVSGWGAKSAAALLSRYTHLEGIPRDPGEWDVPVRGAKRLAAALAEGWKDALLFRDLATLRVDRGLLESVDRLRWRGPEPGFAGVCERLGAPGLASRAETLARERG
jgi:5'-3' exonuclease